MVSAFLVGVVLMRQTPPASESTFGVAIVKYCKSVVGKQIGAGECADLAVAALKASGAAEASTKDNPAPGDYVWGDFVYEASMAGGKPHETPDSKARESVRPGDIVQFRDAVFANRTNSSYYKATFSHHSAVVASVSNHGLLWSLYQQNANGKRTVVQSDLNLAHMRSGYLLVYRAKARSAADQ